MYTQCPKCETTFKLGADDLRRANGKVRCGDCDHVFNALEFLAEEVEEKLVAEGAETEGTEGWTRSDRNPSGELDPDLDEYESNAYLDEEDAETSTEVEEEVEDDEHHDDDDDGPILHIGDDSEPPEETTEAETVEEHDEEPFEETDVEFDDDVWDQVAGVVTHPADEDEETDADEDESAEPEDAEHAADQDGGDDLEFNVPEDKWGNFFGPLPKGESAAVWQPPQFEDADTPEHADDAWEELTAEEEETEFAATEDDDDAPSWKDTETDTSHARLYLIGSIALAALVVMQLLHYNRDHLAASASWGSNIRAIYGAIGSPLYPDWSISDYEIRGSEAVAGETGRDILDIRAQITNTGSRATGLPRLRIMLKDRWSNPVAAQDFSAGEYATDVPTDGLMQPGDIVSAHVSIQDPGSGAQGFELELCLPRRDTGLECTGQPFK